MRIKPLRADLILYAKKHGIQKKVEKQCRLFEANSHHPSLHTELLLPKQLRLQSFRIDRKYRAIFIMTQKTEAEIIDINDHYQ